MPIRPKPRCSTCGRLGCTEHKRPPWVARGERREARPERTSYAETKRRREVVAQFMAEHGITLPNGDVIARCPQCHQMKARFVADHVVPLAVGGSETGRLRVHCASCSGRQGAAITNAKRRRG